MKDTLTIPESWNEITIDQYQEIQTLNKDQEGYDAELIAIITDTDPALIERLDLQTYGKIMLSIQWMLKLPEEANYKPIITVEGNEYGLIKLSALTNGQWYSIEDWLSDFHANTHKILAMLYRPLITAINDDYRILEDYDADSAAVRADLFKQKLSMAEGYGALVFFSLTEKNCIKTIKEYLEIQIVVNSLIVPKWMKRMIMKRSLRKFKAGNGHGLLFFTPLLKAISAKWKKSSDSTSFTPQRSEALN